MLNRFMQFSYFIDFLSYILFIDCKHFIIVTRNVFTDLKARLNSGEKVVEELKRENTSKLQNTQLPVH